MTTPMTMNEGLLHRWSRRKQAAKAAPALPSVEAPLVPEPASPPPDLPSIESLGVASDYTAFLQQGVTAEVQRLALRRAWESDAQIAGFRGMAEYAWDFNAPAYGRLWAADDVAQLLRAVLEPPVEEPFVGEPGAVEPDLAVAEAPGPAESKPAVAERHDAEPTMPTESEAAPEEAAPELGLRRHGSALPC